MPRVKPLEIVIYGRNMVDLRRGAKRIHLNTFTEDDAGLTAAHDFAKSVAGAIGQHGLNTVPKVVRG